MVLVLRENSVPTDFIGFRVPEIHPAGMKILLMMVVMQSLNLVVFAWLDRVAFMQILALRQQLCVYKRKLKPPKLRNRDRRFWLLLSKICRDWTSELILVRPETVIRWRKKKFREFWMAHPTRQRTLSGS